MDLSSSASFRSISVLYKQSRFHILETFYGIALPMPDPTYSLFLGSRQLRGSPFLGLFPAYLSTQQFLFAVVALKCFVSLSPTICCRYSARCTWGATRWLIWYSWTNHRDGDGGFISQKCHAASRDTGEFIVHVHFTHILSVFSLNETPSSSFLQLCCLSLIISMVESWFISALFFLIYKCAFDSHVFSIFPIHLQFAAPKKG